jgi:hypothetical protein
MDTSNMWPAVTVLSKSPMPSFIPRVPPPPIGAHGTLVYTYKMRTVMESDFKRRKYGFQTGGGMLFMNMKVNNFPRLRDGQEVPGVEVEFQNRCPLDDLRRILMNNADASGRTMLETLNYAEYYTGERYFNLI